jgi:hypothetical protein
VLIVQTGPVAERVRVREIDDDEGRRLVRIVRRDSGSVVTWRRAQMVLLSAQGMDVAGIARVAFTSEDQVASRQLESRKTVLRGIMNARSSAPLPAMTAAISRARNGGAGTVREWCDLGVPSTTRMGNWVPPTSAPAGS